MTFPHCSGLKAEGFCAKTDQCALYRKWWEGYKTEIVLCQFKKHDRFVPMRLEASAAQPIQSLPIGQTMELFV